MLAAPARGDRPAHLDDADGRALHRSSLHAAPRPDGRGATPARARHGNARHLLAEGLRSAHDALPGRVRVLHLRAAPSSRRAGVPERGRGPLDRARGSGGRVHRGALHARRSARGALSRRARGARGARLRDDARVSRPLCRACPRRDRAPAAPQPGRHVTGRADRAATRCRVDGDHARDDRRASRGAGWTALGLARQGARSEARDDAPRGRALDPVHERDPRRDRGDARGAARVARRAPRAGERARAPARGDRPELPRETGHTDGRSPGCVARGAPLVGRRCANRARTGDARAGATEPRVRGLSAACSTRGSTTGAGSRRSHSIT